MATYDCPACFGRGYEPTSATTLGPCRRCRGTGHEAATEKDFVAECGGDYLDAAPTLPELLESLVEFQGEDPNVDIAVWQGPRLVAIVQGDGGVLIINAPADRLPDLWLQLAAPNLVQGNAEEADEILRRRDHEIRRGGG